MAPSTVPGLLRAALTVVGVSVLAVAGPLNAAHADPGTDSTIDQNTREVARISGEYDKVHAALASTRLIADTVAAKLAPLAATADPLGFTLKPALFEPPATSRPAPESVQDMASARGELDAEKARLDALIAGQTQQENALAAKKATVEASTAALVKERQEATAAAERASRSTSASTSSGSNTPPPNVSGKAGIAVQFAYAQLGKPYVFGAAGPGSYDCSGLTMAAWGAAGVGIGGHLTNSQWAATTRIGRGDLQPGDLVFFYGLGHVGIYVGNNQVIHAPQPGESVKISDVDSMGGYDGAGRVSA
ncbi:C40 family peptidase [Longispora sp. K20-0274]|uniref:C40 family peptidase n=1 Tax=Longispora sp. K20-0274 TaxID=3088255 RepID=UPI00399BD732